MSAKIRGRSYGGGSKEAVDGDGETTASKKMKTEKRDHCPPYNKDNVMEFRRNYALIPEKAQKYYEIYGSCLCLADGERCDHGKLVRNKFTPWTKFPTANGHFFEEKFVTWRNPQACRSRIDVQRIWKPNLVVVDADGDMKLKFDYNHMNTDKWMKFWYAVDQLYEWVHDRKTIDATTLQHLMGAYYHGVKDVYKTSKNEVGKGARQRYSEAGLLDTERGYHARLYKHFRDEQQDYYRLSDEEKDMLMNELLQEKAKVVELFDKVELLHKLHVLDDKAGRWLRHIGTEELAALALLGLRAGAAATGGADDEEAEEQVEDSGDGEGDSVDNAHSEDGIQSRKCSKHNIVFRNCADPDCKDEYQAIWNAYQQGFNGSKDWAKTFAEREKASREGGLGALLFRMQELNVGSVW